VAPANPWLDRRVLAYAHQGGAWERPSSTLAAIDHALSVGATGIELDVHSTADGHLVVCHDTTVDRTTEGDGAIASMTLAEVQALDPAYWFIPGADTTPGRPAADYPWRGRARDDPDFRIPTLREVLERFPGVVLNLDIKQTAPAVRGYESELASILREFDRRDDVIVASFHDSATEAFRRHAPEIATSAGTAAVASFWRSMHTGEALPPMPHVALQVPEERHGVTIVDERFVEEAHRAGLAVHVWTIDDEEAMKRLLAKGVDGIITDLPTTLSGVLAVADAAWKPS
jgi:glycerophosphoryl diester phosphodiesterase